MSTAIALDELKQSVSAAEFAVSEISDKARQDRAFEIVLATVLARPQAEAKPSTRNGGTKKTRRARTPDGPSQRSRRSNGPQALIAAFAEEGFFDTTRSAGQIVDHLREGGHVFPAKQIATCLQRLTQTKMLRREQVVGEKGRKGWVYRRYQ